MLCHVSLMSDSLLLCIGLVDDGLDAIHQDSAFTLRLSSYFLRPAGASPAPRCGEHKDFGTITVLFQASTNPRIICQQQAVEEHTPCFQQS